MANNDANTANVSSQTFMELCHSFRTLDHAGAHLTQRRNHIIDLVNRRSRKIKGTEWARETNALWDAARIILHAQAQIAEEAHRAVQRDQGA